MELSQTNLVAEQDKKIKIYEQKLRDLIEAYKTLSKEKEAMNCTVKSLLVMNKKEKNEDVGDDDNKQIILLSNAITTLSDEKQKLERNYLEDKKLTKIEYESNLSTLKKELESQSIIIKELSAQVGERNKISQQKIDELTSEKNDLSENLTMKNSIIARLTEECSGIQILQNEWTNEMSMLKNGYEARLSLLEESITQLSETVNQLEHQHVIDQETIQKLYSDHRSTKTCRSQNCSHLESTPDILQFQDLYMSDKILRTDSKNFIIDDPSILKCNGDCELKINELRQQLELNSKSLLDSYNTEIKSSYNSGHSQLPENDKNEELKNELSIAKLKIEELQEEISSIDAGTNRNLKTMKETMLNTEWKYKQDIAKLQQTHNVTVMELQSELTKHRNRTIDLLTDKDSEIKSLQKQMHTVHRIESDSKISDSELESDLSWIGCNLNSCPLYQCCEMKARMNQELKRLRNVNRELLMENHKLESDLQYIKSDWNNEVDLLTKRVQRAETINKLSSGVNLEYLRNVLMQFIGTSDPSSKYLMVKAIGKVLQFSSEELASLRMQ